MTMEPGRFSVVCLKWSYNTARQLAARFRGCWYHLQEYVPPSAWGRPGHDTLWQAWCREPEQKIGVHFYEGDLQACLQACDQHAAVWFYRQEKNEHDDRWRKQN